MRLRHPSLFRSSGPLELVTMEIVRPLPKTTNCHQLVIIITDRLSKLIGVVPTPKTDMKHIKNIFYDNWNVPYRIPTYLLTDNETQFVSKDFENICHSLGLKHITTIA